MHRLIASLTFLLLPGLVLARAVPMRVSGIRAIYFANIDRKDLFIPPLALFYAYIIVATPLGLPALTERVLFRSIALSWVGVSLCLAGFVAFLVSLVSFGPSFRVGIDTDHAGEL